MHLLVVLTLTAHLTLNSTRTLNHSPKRVRQVTAVVFRGRCPGGGKSGRACTRPTPGDINEPTARATGGRTVDHGRRLDVGLRVSQAPSTTASTNNLQRQQQQQQQRRRRRRRRRRPPVTTDVLIAASRTRRRLKPRSQHTN